MKNRSGEEHTHQDLASTPFGAHCTLISSLLSILALGIEVDSDSKPNVGSGQSLPNVKPTALRVRRYRRGGQIVRFVEEDAKEE